jgi:hypothetical protein
LAAELLAAELLPDLAAGLLTAELLAAELLPELAIFKLVKFSIYRNYGNLD